MTSRWDALGLAVLFLLIIYLFGVVLVLGQLP